MEGGVGRDKGRERGWREGWGGIKGGREEVWSEGRRWSVAILCEE